MSKGNNFIEEWNHTHQVYNEGCIISDDWLIEFEEYFLPLNGLFLDLGCGSGNDTNTLINKYGKHVISCDFSNVALSQIKRKIPTVETCQFDMTEPFPFEDDKFDCVITDLSLQYFDRETTSSIINEISRVLVSGGLLLLRVSSTEDINYGALKGDYLDYHYYYVQYRNKRFYDKQDVMDFFSDWDNVLIKDETMEKGRYKHERRVIVAMFYNRKKQQ